MSKTVFIFGALATVAVIALAAATSEVPSLRSQIIVEPYGSPVVRGFSPEIRIGKEEQSDILSVIYVARRGSRILSSEDRGAILGREPQQYLSILMATSRPTTSHLSMSIIERIGNDYTSAILIRRRTDEVDRIIAFNEVGVQSSSVYVEETPWRGAFITTYTPTTIDAKSTIIFLGGTDGETAHSALAGWAILGSRVVSIPWVQGATQTPGCLDRIDLGAVSELVGASYRANVARGPVSLVGHSGGADAVLMIANRSSIPFQSVHAIAPTAWHFNGARGPACMLPSSPWMIAEAPVPYILNFPVDWGASVALLRRHAGGLSQKSLAVEALQRVDAETRRRIAYDVGRIEVPTFLYAGGLDDLTPSAETVTLFCGLIEGSHCYINEQAGHDIFGMPADPVYCRSPQESLNGTDRKVYCRQMAIAKEHVFRSVSDSVSSDYILD